MRHLPPFLSILVIALFAFYTRSASAQSEQSVETEPATFDLHLDAQVGVYGGREGGGLTVGALLLARGSLFEAGAQAQAGAGLFAYDYASLGGLAGIGFSPAEHWRLDLLGELGVDSYDHFGHGSFFSGDPGASAVRHYAGGRIAIMRRAGIFEIGYAAGFTSDLDNANVQYTYADVSWLGDSNTMSSRTVRVGTYRVTTMLTLGAAFDL